MGLAQHTNIHTMSLQSHGQSIGIPVKTTHRPDKGSSLGQFWWCISIVVYIQTDGPSLCTRTSVSNENTEFKSLSRRPHKGQTMVIHYVFWWCVSILLRWLMDWPTMVLQRQVVLHCVSVCVGYRTGLTEGLYAYILEAILLLQWRHWAKAPHGKQGRVLSVGLYTHARHNISEYCWLGSLCNLTVYTTQQPAETAEIALRSRYIILYYAYFFIVEGKLWYS